MAATVLIIFVVTCAFVLTSADTSTDDCRLAGQVSEALTEMDEDVATLLTLVERLTKNVDAVEDLPGTHFGHPHARHECACPPPPEPECPIVSLTGKDESLPARDCYEYQQRGHNESGIYEIFPYHHLMLEPVRVYCDMDTDGGGWTLIQRRGDFGEARLPVDELEWFDYAFYVVGPLDKEFFLGLQFMHVLTQQKGTSLRVDLEDFEGNRRFAKYDDFYVKPEEEQFGLLVEGYSGDAGDALSYSNNSAFTARNKDLDNNPDGNCAVKLKGGWWHNDCTRANLNGLYLRGQYEAEEPHGIFWKDWKGEYYSLKSVEMKIRPSEAYLRAQATELMTTP